jgi:hypothetical protein
LDVDYLERIAQEHPRDVVILSMHKGGRGLLFVPPGQSWNMRCAAFAPTLLTQSEQAVPVVLSFFLDREIVSDDLKLGKVSNDGWKESVRAVMKSKEILTLQSCREVKLKTAFE